jgi:superfamily I DNA/RNA helicase/RecB family exonuclease
VPAQIRVTLSYDPALLLDEAASGFFEVPRGTAGNPFPSPRYLLVLRQGGLRDDLLRLAARRGWPGWFDPPLCLFAELREWLGSTDRRALSATERRVLVARILHDAGATVFTTLRRQADYVDAVDAFFGELCAADVAPAGLARALDAASDRDDFERRRDAELQAAYAAYHERLREERLRDGRDALADCARAVAADPDALAERLGARRELRIVGLQDLRGGWTSLLGALAASPALDAIGIYTSVPLDLAALDAETVDLRARDTLASRLFAPPRHAKLARGVHAIMAPSTSRELEEVAARVRALCETGVAPHRIAIVSRQARPHVDLAVDTLRRAGVPATARQRVSVHAIPAVRAVLTLLDAAADDWSRHGLVEVAENPYLDTGLDARALNAVGYRRQVRGLAAWRAALAEQGERGATSHFFTRAADIDGHRPLAQWVAWLGDVVERDSWGIATRMSRLPEAERHDVARADLAGWRCLRSLAWEWADALARFGGGDEATSAGAFAARLRAHCEGDVAFWTETQHGVQVFEGTAAAYRAFDHVFVVGLEGGAFPMRAPRSPLLGDVDRERLVAAGLPLDDPGAWDARERELFRVIAEGARAGLTLSWSRLDDGGREVVRSTFVDDVEDACDLRVTAIPASSPMSAALPLVGTALAARHAHQMATIERGRQTGALSAHNGLIEDEALRAELAIELGDDRIWSPTQLESYAKCPWAYLAARLLRMETVTEPDDGLEPKLRGTVLHRALERFYDHASRERGGAPVLLVPEDRAHAERGLLRELDAALAEEAAKGSWLGAPALRAALREELARILVRYLEFELDHARKLFSARSKNIGILRTGVAAHEVRFDDVALAMDGITLRLRGVIDRVEVGVDDRVPGAGDFVAAVDYKTTSSAVPGGGDRSAWDDGVVLQVPLYARVLEELYPGRTVSRIEYRTLKGRSVEHGLQLYQVSKLPAIEENIIDNERMVTALRAAAGHVRAARAGEFPARPAPSCGCPSWCPAIDVCRVPGGPRVKSW